MDLRALIAKMDHIEGKRTLMEAGDPAEYARAQQQMARLEKAAQYTGDDEIVRRRMGLPPKLPPIEQWDGKMPQPTGKPDWVARLTTGGQATIDQDTAVKTNKADDTSVAFVKEKVSRLKELIAKISAPASESIVFKSDIAKKLVESFSYSLNEAEAPAEKFPNEVAEIKKIMGELSDIGDSDTEVAKVLADAQAALDKLASQTAAPGSSANPPAGGQSDTGAQNPPGTIDPAKLKRFKELLDKAEAGSSANPPAGGQQGKPAAFTPAELKGQGSYTIKPGDTLSKIAQTNKTTVQAIMAVNPQIKDPNRIAAGAKLTLPGGQGSSANPPAGGSVPAPSKPLPGKAVPGGGQISDTPAA